MKRTMFLVTLCVALMGFAFQAAAAIDYPPKERIVKVISADKNLMKVCFNEECTDFYLVAYKTTGTVEGFPRGTRGTHHNGRVYYTLLGQPEREITSDQIIGNVPTNINPTGGTIVRVSETTVSQPIGNVTVVPKPDVPGQFPNDKMMPEPSMFLYYPTGSNELTPAAIETLKQKRQQLNNNPDAMCIIEGVCSIDDAPWTCYYTPDYSYFRQESLYDGRPGVIKKTGAHECNEALSYSRAVAPILWFRANGVNEYNTQGRRRLYPIKYPSYGNVKAYKGINPKLANQSAIGFLLNDDQYVIGPTIPAPGNTVQQKPCPECPAREIRYFVPEGCGIIEETVDNVTTVKMLCVKECNTTVIYQTTKRLPRERGDDAGLWILGGGGAAAVIPFLPTGDGGDGGDGGTSGHPNGHDGKPGDPTTVCNGDPVCIAATIAGGMVIGWASYECKEAYLNARDAKARKAEEAEATRQSQQAQNQPARVKH